MDAYESGIDAEEIEYIEHQLGLLIERYRAALQRLSQSSVDEAVRKEFSEGLLAQFNALHGELRDILSQPRP